MWYRPPEKTIVGSLTPKWSNGSAWARKRIGASTFQVGLGFGAASAVASASSGEPRARMHKDARTPGDARLRGGVDVAAYMGLPPLPLRTEVGRRSGSGGTRSCSAPAQVISNEPAGDPSGSWPPRSLQALPSRSCPPDLLLDAQKAMGCARVAPERGRIAPVDDAAPGHDRDLVRHAEREVEVLLDEEGEEEDAGQCGDREWRQTEEGRHGQRGQRGQHGQALHHSVGPGSAASPCGRAMSTMARAPNRTNEDRSERSVRPSVSICPMTRAPTSAPRTDPSPPITTTTRARTRTVPSRPGRAP